MRWKVLLGILIASSFLVTSCYPELSVQQYDKLRKDLTDLDVQRQSLDKELTNLKTKNAQTLAYVSFLEKLEATQSSEKILSGQFDAVSLINARGDLTTLANSLGDSDIVYLLGVMKPDNNSQTMAAYYKIIEDCLKKIKQNLQ